MNITSCPNCGGKVEPESIGWKCEKCLGFIDMCGIFHGPTKSPFIPPPTNGDHIREKIADDFELAKLAVEYEGSFRIIIDENGGGKHIYCGPDGEIIQFYDIAVQAWMDWLTQPAKEG